MRAVHFLMCNVCVHVGVYVNLPVDSCMCSIWSGRLLFPGRTIVDVFNLFVVTEYVLNWLYLI
jgi:hypothetical protein